MEQLDQLLVQLVFQGQAVEVVEQVLLEVPPQVFMLEEQAEQVLLIVFQVVQ